MAKGIYQKKEHARLITELHEKIHFEFTAKGRSDTLLGILYKMSNDKLKFWM